MSTASASLRHTLVPRTPPQALFVLGALAQYVGSGYAVLLFATVPAAAVAWLRIVFAAGALAAWRRPWTQRWTARTLRLAALFGAFLGAMNLLFYLAIERLPMGTTVALEFIGPIVLAAVGSRSRRDAAAVALVALGIVLLADVHLAGEPLGVALALAAGACWAGYIVCGHRVARAADVEPGQGLALGMVFAAVAIAPLAVTQVGPALTEPTLLLACAAVALLASVVPYGLDQIAMQRLGRARFALLLALLPATAAVVGAVMLGQVPTAPEAVGIGLVVVAATLRTHVSDEDGR